MAARCECGKRSYDDQMAALTAACRNAGKFGRAFRVCRCLVNTAAWHLTTKPARTWVRAETREATR
jgi:hypothetical protein